MRVLLILGHPRHESFNAALWAAAEEGLREARIDYRTLDVGRLAFEQDVLAPSPADQALEPDLVRSQQLIDWAEHLIFVYPTWWGTMPARLKAWLDRVLCPGFAFAFHEKDAGWDKLLTGKTAEIITTMDTPSWVYRWIYGSPGHRAMSHATLGFCGVRTVRITEIGPIHHSTETQRARWLAQANGLGRALSGGAVRGLGWVRERASAWKRALRLQFYPMTALAYAVGAFAAAGGAAGLDMTVFLLGYLCLFWLEAATVFSNEYFDFEADRRNTQAGPFNGGSRVLVEGLVSLHGLRRGIWLTLAAFAVSTVILLALLGPMAVPAAVTLPALAVLALGYTVPPLMLSHRGWGEIDVALTHSLGVILCGYVFQGGVWYDPLPWLISLPLFLAVLPAILLANIPDREPDEAAGKQTLPVRWGSHRTGWMALASVVGAALSVVAIFALNGLSDPYGPLLLLAMAHAGLLAALLLVRLSRDIPEARWQSLNGTLVVALSFILWFGVLPLLQFA